MGLKIVDLFSGIGGFSLSGREVGWETLLFCEIEKFPQLVLKKNFPGILIHSDIKTLTKGIIEKEFINRYGYYEPKELILTGGVPCQPASTAGKRRGRTDDRWLWDEATRLVREVKPAFALFENVTGLISLENGKALEKIFADLENEGYTVESFIIPACGVGAWHRRDRIWIIAYTKGYGDRREFRASNGTQRQKQRPENQHQDESQRFEPAGEILSSDVSKSTDSRIESMRGRENQANDKSRDQNVPNSDIPGSQGWNSGELQKCTDQQPARKGNSQNNGSYWESEPDVGRVAHGVSNRVHRLKGLGNAIVPQIAFELFKAIEMVNNLSK